MKKSILLASGLAVALAAAAFTEVTETMTVRLADGTAVGYDIDQVEKVDFETVETTVGLLFTGADGTEIAKTGAMTSMFRFLPADNDQAVRLYFGTAVGAESFAALGEGSHVFLLDCALSALYQGEVSLTGASGITLTGFEIADGVAASELPEVSQGTVTTTRNAKGVLTVELDAVLADGSALRASYTGSPSDITSVEELFPSGEIKNEMSYYGYSGDVEVTSAITGVKITDYNDWKRFTFTFESASAQSCTIEIDPAAIGQQIDFATLESHTVNFRYGSVQVSGPNDQYRNQGVEGTILITDNGDGTVTILADVTNKYKNMWGSGTSGTPERVVLSYSGPCEGLAPVIKNEITFFNPDGVQINYTEISSVKKTTSSGLSKYIFTVTDDAIDWNWGSQLFVMLDPELVGQEVDLLTETKSAACVVTDVQVSNFDRYPAPLSGKLKVIDNGDGNVTITADFANASNNRVVLSYDGALK